MPSFAADKSGVKPVSSRRRDVLASRHLWAATRRIPHAAWSKRWARARARVRRDRARRSRRRRASDPTQDSKSSLSTSPPQARDGEKPRCWSACGGGEATSGRGPRPSTSRRPRLAGGGLAFRKGWGRSAARAPPRVVRHGWQPRRTTTRRPCARPPVWSPSRARHRSHRISPFAHPTPRLPLPDRRGLLLTRAPLLSHSSVSKPEP
ncbi:hypothetical protein PVAP13_3KG296200 [Panicum virgatum]|uniref:Uncharacterized protein n=1 Tax=Panicum virgatum TaxID=38727 RepID=A0A8T0UUM0_PANVG|nr:hypothetical protein PVAP13_3KG296200 [Panicum virgatum]